MLLSMPFRLCFCPGGAAAGGPYAGAAAGEQQPGGTEQCAGRGEQAAARRAGGVDLTCRWLLYRDLLSATVDANHPNFPNYYEFVFS